MRHLTVQQISASLDGALVGVSLELVVRHLATCRECRARHARLSKQDDTLRHLLAWDPGAEYFEDASIRLETILDAQSRGVAPPRIAELEAHLPRVTLDEVLRAAQAATVTPCPAPSAEAASSEKPTMQFPSWMQPETNRPVTPRPLPREPRKPTTPIEPVVLGRKEPPVMTPVIIPEPEPVAQVAPVAPVIVPVIVPEPEPIALVMPVPAPIAARTPEPVPTTEAPPIVARRRALPRWVPPMAFTAAGITALLAALSALPPVIRIPEPELPRFPRIELVKRQPTPAPETSLKVAATEQATSRLTANAVPPVAVATPPTLVEPAGSEPEPFEAVVHEPSHTGGKPPTPMAMPAARQTTPARPTSAPVLPVAPVVPAATSPVEPTTTTSDVDPAADWPLLCGEVLDDTGAPVAGARVLLADLDLGARTDKRGRFCLAAPPGDRTLSVVALGFAAARQVVSLGTQTLEVRIALHPAP